MTNLTKLFCDLLSAGSQIASATSTEEVSKHINALAFHHLPEDCDVDLGAIEDHIDSMRSALKGADHDIDNVRARLAQGKPVSVQKIVEFRGQMTVKLDNGNELTFDSSEVTHY